MNTNRLSVNDDEKFPEIVGIPFSRHAAIRCQQKGVRALDLLAVSRHADICIPRGNGVELVRISKTKLQKMGNRTPEGVATDRLRNTCLLLSEDYTVITVIHPRRGRYKRGKTVRRKYS
jgi:hypothetical protein